MPAKKYKVVLSGEDRKKLEQIINKGKEAAYKRRHAHILLKSDQSPEGPSWKDEKIKEVFGESFSTIGRVRKRFFEEGLEAAIGRKEPTKRKRKALDGKQEAHLIALCCSDPPEGRKRWTIHLLTKKMVELEYVETLSYETTRKVLKKANLNLG